MVPGATRPSREALEHIDAYMKNGGTVLFDTRDAIEGAPGSGTVSPNTAGAAHHPRPRSTSRSSSRCRAITC